MDHLTYLHFREVFSLMDAMKVDMANFQLQTIKPHLVQQSIEYERKKFKDYLQSNPGTFYSNIYMYSWVEFVMKK